MEPGEDPVDLDAKWTTEEWTGFEWTIRYHVLAKDDEILALVCERKMFLLT